MVSAASLTLCQSTKLDINFMFKNSKGSSYNRNVEAHSTVTTDANGFARLMCGKKQDFILNFIVQENNDKEVTIETEILNVDLLVAKPKMIIPYNQRGVIEIGEKSAEKTEFSEFCLSIVPSKEELSC